MTKRIYVTDEAHAAAKAAAALTGQQLDRWASAALQAVARQQVNLPREEEPRLDRRAAS